MLYEVITAAAGEGGAGGRRPRQKRFDQCTTVFQRARLPDGNQCGIERRGEGGLYPRAL